MQRNLESSGRRVGYSVSKIHLFFILLLSEKKLIILIIQIYTMEHVGAILVNVLVFLVFSAVSSIPRFLDSPSKLVRTQSTKKCLHCFVSSLFSLVFAQRYFLFVLFRFTEPYLTDYIYKKLCK